MVSNFGILTFLFIYFISFFVILFFGLGSPFFSYEGGRNSPYGEQAVVLLRSLVVEGGLQPTAYAKETCRVYGEGWTGYRDASTKVRG